MNKEVKKYLEFVGYDIIDGKDGVLIGDCFIDGKILRGGDWEDYVTGERGYTEPITLSELQAMLNSTK